MQWMLLLCVSFLMAGCTAQKDTVVLLENLPGNHSKVVIDGPGHTSTLAVPRDAADLHGGTIVTRASTVEDVQKVFASVLAPPPVARVYHILFDTGERELSPGDEKILTALMADIVASYPAEVEISGFTDTVGTIESNDRLSQNRALAVRDALIQRGLKASLIRTVGRGERNLLVPTADNVAEKRNRRVEVLVR